MILQDQVAEHIRSLSLKGLYRKAAVYRNNLRLNFSSNDYLCVSTHPKVIDAARNALEKYGSGSGASRLVSTTHPLHEDLQQTVSELVPEKWQSILLSSGFAANLAFFDLFRSLKINIEIFVDHRAHASLVFSVRSSGLPVYFYEHNNIKVLREKVSRSKAELKIVVAEALHSMDGDFEDFQGLADLCASTRDTFVYIDESHASGLAEGVFWSFSSCSTKSLEPYLLGVMAGCGKAIGCGGGLLLLPQFLCELAHQSARPFMYSTAPPPSVVASVKESLGVLGSSEGLELRLQLQQHLKQFNDLVLQFKSRSNSNFQFVLKAMKGQKDHLQYSPIVSVYPKTSLDLCNLKELLETNAIAVGFMRPPTVPKGTERFRLSFNVANDPSEFERFLIYFFESGGSNL